MPNVLFLPGQETTWVLNSAKNQLFLVIRQLIWLGKENGYLLLFHPMDHALLNQISYPDTRLSLWWNDKPVASSEGEQGLSLAELSFNKIGKDNSVLLLSWAGVESAKVPKIFVESTSQPLLDFRQLAVALAVILFLFLFSCWFSFGAWWLRNMVRIQALSRAQIKFETLHKLDEIIDKDLQVAHAFQNDEISFLTLASERMMLDSMNKDQRKAESSHD